MSYLQRLAVSVNGAAEQAGAVRVALPSRFAPGAAGMDRQSFRADGADADVSAEQGARQSGLVSEHAAGASATSRAPARDFTFSLGTLAIARDDGGSAVEDVPSAAGARLPSSAFSALSPPVPVDLEAAGASAGSAEGLPSLANELRLLQHAVPASPPQRPLSDLALASRAPEPRPTPPVIQVTIDRIDVHTPSPAPSNRVQRPSRAMPYSVSLSDYLRGRRTDGAGS